MRAGAPVDGDRLRLRLLRQGGDGEIGFGFDDIGTGFRHDAGFGNQAGVCRRVDFHRTGWRGAGPHNDFFLNVDAHQVRDRVAGAVVQEVVRGGLYVTAARDLEWWLRWVGHSRVRTESTATLLAEHYLSAGLVMTPATWFPLVDTSIDLGRLAGTAASPRVAGTPQGVVRKGGRYNLAARLRPLAALKLEPRLNIAWLRDAGRQTDRETAQRWLAVWHFDARHNLRAIVQRCTLDRRAEPSVAATEGLSRTGSLIDAWRYNAGPRLPVGATRSRQGRTGAAAATEAFLKLQLDADDLRRMGS